MLLIFRSGYHRAGVGFKAVKFPALIVAGQREIFSLHLKRELQILFLISTKINYHSGFFPRKKQNKMVILIKQEAAITSRWSDSFPEFLRPSFGSITGMRN